MTNSISKENSPKGLKGKRLYGHLVFRGRRDYGYDHEAARLPEDDPGHRERVHFGGVRKGPFQAGPELYRGGPSDGRIFPGPRLAVSDGVDSDKGENEFTPFKNSGQSLFIMSLIRRFNRNLANMLQNCSTNCL